MMNAKPIVKWAGGKRQLIDKLLELMPEEYNNYFEPFIGGGALLFAITPDNATIGDVNEDLLAIYRCLADKELFRLMVEDLEEHEKDHSEEYYYEIRNIDRKPEFEALSVDMIFADPPYFLSGNGITCVLGKMVSVKKANWDEEIGIKEKLLYNRRWIRKCKDILKNTGTLWISGTFHNIHTIGVALELEGFEIINNVTWRKLNPPPNIFVRKNYFGMHKGRRLSFRSFFG